MDLGGVSEAAFVSDVEFLIEALANNAQESKEESQFQAEDIFNKLLPYADKLDSEADALLAKIKANLGRCVMLRDIKPGCVIWTNMLHKYTILYNLRLTKEDHITFIKLIYELVTVPNLEPCLVSAFGYCLNTLLRYNYLISPTELELPWRPLYNVCRRFMLKVPGITSLSREIYPATLNNVLESIVIAAKVFFPINATQEILDELRPQICPFDLYIMQVTMKGFQLFLPVHLAVEHHSRGHELWFHEFLKLWEVCGTSSLTWGNSVMFLMSNLAYYNIGHIDWEANIPLMFTRFVQSFNLPVSYKKKGYNSRFEISPCYMGLWIASVLGNKSSAQAYLSKFLKTVETYFHPANYGPWLKPLEEFFMNLSNFVVLRINRQSYQNDCDKSIWKSEIPDSHKLTDADIDAFVTSMMPIARLGIFNRFHTQSFYDALRYLAIMRPNLVIPNVLEKVSPNFDREIEPHKMITVIECMTTLSRPLVQGSRIVNKEYAFKEGPAQVLPLLFAALSAIDPNDIIKCYNAFGLIATYVTMIPMVDSSHQSTDEMSEEDRLVCKQTSRFEDFVLQFMDKVFTWIDSQSVISTRIDNDNGNSDLDKSAPSARLALSKVFSTILCQVSPSIFDSALNKLRSFIMERVLETQVAGQLVSVLCQNFSDINSENTLKALLPFLLERVLDAIGEDDDIFHAYNLDNELLYSLLLINKLVFTPAKYLLPYMDTLLQVIDKTLMLKSPTGNRLGCFTLDCVLQSLSTVSFINVERNLDNPQHPLIQDWGTTPNKIKEAKIQSYIPGDEEAEILQKIFTRYFMPVVTKIQNFIKSQDTLSRDDLEITLRILLNILAGSDAALPFWSEPPLKLESYENCTERLEPFLGFAGNVHMPDGSNVRYFLVQLMAQLQEIMLTKLENDTNSLSILQMVWETLMIGKLQLSIETGITFRTNYCVSKNVLKNNLIGSQGWFPTLILARVSAQHSIRQLCTTLVLTETHKSILLHLLKLSTSRYSAIRKFAQDSLVRALGYFPNAYIVLTAHIIEILERDPTDHHDAHKGILHLLTRMINRRETLLVIQDWGFIKRLWPALLLSGTSEKASIIQLRERINTGIRHFYTVNIQIEIADSVVSLAKSLWTAGESIKPNEPQPTEDEVQKGADKLRERGEINLKMYNELLNTLFNALLEENLHWRQRQMAVNCIIALAHNKVQFSAKMVRFFLNLLISESITERQGALEAIMHVFKQQKKKRIKRKIDVRSNSINGVQPGYREDNAWLQYNSDCRPTNSAEWDERRYMHKSYLGYYAWPREIEIYAASCEQPGYEKTNLSQQDREIEQFFGDQQNVDRLIGYLSLEGKKDLDQFSKIRMFVFKGLFRNHGDTFLGNLLPHLRRLVAEKQESSQRCAAEIIGGIITGSKHWPYDMAERLWRELVPILRGALSNLTVETINDWFYCMSLATLDRDPNTLHWLFECLVEESPLGQSEASFVECGKLTILQGVLTRQVWRLAELLNRLLVRFESRIQESPFRNVRDSLALMLVEIFQANRKFNPTVSCGNPFPEINNFLEKMYPRLQSLLEEDESSNSLGNDASAINTEDAEAQASQSLSRPDVINPTREQCIRLFKTVCTWIRYMLLTCNLDDVFSFYRIYPIMCHLESNEEDKELSETCTETIAVLACALTPPKHVSDVLEAVMEISKSTSWSTRASCLEFLQTLVFHNMSILLSNEAWIETAQNIVLKLLEDERLEVRVEAAKVLGGLLHCEILPNQEALLAEFKIKSNTALVNTRERKLNKNKDNAITAVKITNAIRLRHAGVLGMCAFIQAHPYSVPEIVIQIFERLSSHRNDPDPISGTIRKTLNDFKRTHCDGWTGLQGLTEYFTEAQFALLEDLTEPPSYFS